MHSPNSDTNGLPYTPYTRTGGSPLNLDAIDGEHDADIAVIGAGATGLSTALHASLAGLRVVVLEAKEVGWGASSRNSGHMPAATRQEPAAILRDFGPEYGPRIIHGSREAPELVWSLVEKYGMDVGAVRTGGIQAAHNRAAWDKLRQRADDLKRFGYEVRLLDAAQTAEAVGSVPGLYMGSVLDPAGGTLNPLAYTRGLARAAIREGTVLHERSTATALEKTARGWLTKCKTGSVRSRFVAVCTNGYSHGLLPELWRSIIGVRAYQFMTTPLPQDVRRTILPGRQGFTDTRRMMSGVRLHEDGRLHFSGIGNMFGPETKPNVEASLARVRGIFPQIGDVGLDYWWSGWMAMNRETTWKLHEIQPGLLAALGCSGRGLGLGTLYGRELASYMSGKRATDLILPFSPVEPIWAHPVRQAAVSVLAHGYRVMDALETARVPLAANDTVPRRAGGA